MADRECNVQTTLSGDTCTSNCISSSTARRARVSVVYISGTQRERQTTFCDGCCCSLLWYVCCSRKPNRQRCTEMLWFLIFSLALTTSLGIALGLFGVNAFETAPTDMRIINDKYSTLFCQTLSLKADIPFEAFTFHGQLNLSSDSRQNFKHEYSKFIEKDDYYYFHYYLLSNSIVNLVTCTDEVMTLYVIKGYSNFNEWKEHQHCDTCYMTKIPIKPSDCFLKSNNYSLTVEETGDFYFVFSNRQMGTWLTANFDINRVLYNLDLASRVCEGATECEISIPFNCGSKVVFHMGDDPTRRSLTMSSTCYSRVWLYLVIFVFAPTVTGLILSVIIYFSCSGPQPVTFLLDKRRRINVAKRRFHAGGESTDERTPLLWESEPPKYEDIQQDLSPDPPSYYEITR